MEKNYTIVTCSDTLAQLEQHLDSFSYFAFDVESTGLNVRKDKVIGLSVSGKIGTAFYLPLLSWNKTFHCLRPVYVDETVFYRILCKLKTKELLMWNGSYDIRITNNNFGIDLTEALLADVMLMKHTVDEEGTFKLKEVAIQHQEELGLDVESEANAEQLALKANVAANGGSTTKTNFEMYKADLEVMGPYACFAPNSSFVTMSDGSAKLIENIEAGEYVIDHEGRSSLVYEKLVQDYSGYVYDIETEAGRMQKNVTPYHRFQVLDQYTLKEKWIAVKDLKEGDLLVRPTKIESKKAYGYSGMFWWLYGLYMAEGHVRKQGQCLYPVFSVHKSEAKTIVDCITSLGYQPSVHNKKIGQGCDITICNSDLGKLFIELSGGNFKCDKKQVSQKVLKHLLSEESDCADFLGGIFDGDGHYRKNKKVHQLTLELTSSSLINTVDLLLSNYGINSTRGSYKASTGRKDRHYIKLFGKDIGFLKYCTTIKKINTDNGPEGVSTFKKYIRIKKITSKAYTGKVYNIEVENTHSYLSNGIVSHNCADADLTLRLADFYRQRLEQEELEEFFYDIEVMPLYKLVTIPMENHGVKLDMPLIEATKLSIIEDMSQLEKSILDQLNALPEVQKWLREKAAEKYPPKTTGSFAQAVCERFDLPLPRTSAGKYSLAAKEVQKLPLSEAKAFLLGNEFVIETSGISWELFCKSGQDTINISSKQQMGQIVFNCLGIKPLSKTDKGSPQFDDDLIQHLVDVHKLAWARDLSNYNKLVKIKGTYIDRFLDAHEDGYYYFSYKQHGTISGRYSGDAQQLPRPKEEEELDAIVLKYNNLIRSFFIVASGRVFIDCDYESLEPHVFSHVSNDERLRDIFRKGHDFYSTIAIATEKLEGVSADKKAPNYLGKVNKPVRQKSKAYSLGIPYGLGDYALGMSLGVSKKEAASLIDGYLSGFPDLAHWMDTSEEFVKLNGYIRTESGRVRHLPQVKAIYEKHGDSILDWRYKKDLINKFARSMPYQEAKDKVTNMYRDYKNGLNNAKNVQIQGLSASIINIAMIEINKQFKAHNIDGYVCATIHDQAIMDVPEHHLEKCKEIVVKAMTTTTKLSIELKAPPAVAKNWKDGH